MASTRPPPPPVQVFVDPIPSPTFQGPTQKPRPQLQPSAMPLQPLHNLPNQPEIILTAPPISHSQQMSPLKSHPLSPPRPNYNNLGYVNIPPPNTINLYTDSPMKRPAHPSIHQIRPQPIIQQPLFTTFNSNFDTFEQENYHASTLHHENFVDFPEPYARRQTLKRSFSDVVPMTDRPFKKIKGEDEITTQIPEPEDMPTIEDDGNKPSYSYAQMIGMAILRAPSRRLTLAQIYEWISSTFAYYREDTKQGWHNSIRHNLSLNKAFKKQERPKGDAGKGSYWVIEPGMEGLFVKDKNRKGNSLSHITMHANVMRPEVINLPHAPLEPLPQTPFLVQTNEPPARPQTAPALPELSSDATLPASDPALNEDDGIEFDSNNLPQPRSSPPDAINSSPPVAVGLHRRSGSSPTGRVRQPSSVLRHKRNATTMDDSGYFSSLESSVLRNNKSNIILTSELDIEPSRKKQQRGRAEEEIQRIRSSSHDVTPSHTRFRNHTIGVADGQSSSPLRPSPVARRNPVTPSVVFKKPMRPPPSVSPNTQLEMHRKAMQEFSNSPVKSFGLWANDIDTWSPLKWSSAQYHAPQDEFEIFSDPITGMTPATPGIGSSPARGSVRRSAMTRANMTANILSEVMGNAHRINAKTPSKSTFLKPAPHAVLSGSPLKGSMTNISILDEQDDLFDFGSFENEISDNDEGLDISKGFGRIGGTLSHQNITGAKGATQRPGLARSFTSRF